MHYLEESHILLFLVQVALLLGVSRALGELFRRWGQPSITAEILTGVFFGPTLLGRYLPRFHAMLFPADTVQYNMLETVGWLGILFFLLKAGLETNLASAWRQRRQSMTLSLCDLTLPMVIAFLPSLLLPARYLGPDGNALSFSLFIAVIMTISALPVTARVLQDLRVYRTDLGLLIISALTINDVTGWILFALILGSFSGEAMTAGTVIQIISATMAFAAFSLLLGPRIFDRTVDFMKRLRVPEPAGSLTLMCLAGLAGGAITTWIGIHALFGFFITGIMAGESKLSEHTRHIFSQMVHAILVPLFFASIGLKLDFLGQFDLLLVVFILVIGTFGRYLAAFLGARLIRQPAEHCRFIGLAHIPGGEMQIVIGMVALEYGAISETVYVAIVFGAIVTSVMAGPLMRRVLLRLQKIDWLALLPLDNVLPDLTASERDEAIRELAEAAARAGEPLSAPDIADLVLRRERQMSTALDNHVAVPHARLTGLSHPAVFMGRSRAGIDWDASDGQPVHLIFLILTPANDAQTQIQILRGLAKTLIKPAVRRRLMDSPNASETLDTLRQAGNDQ